jgi:hypothetical protein
MGFTQTIIRSKIITRFFLGALLCSTLAPQAISSDIINKSRATSNNKPRLLYTDLVTAPSGSFVTVWGQNIPSNATLTCGDTPCEVISFDLDLNHPAHGNQPPRQKIVVKFYSGTGITLDGYNTLSFEINNGKIWTARPSDNIGSFLDKMSDGDVLYLRKGKYSTADSRSYGYRKGEGAIIWATDKRDGLAVIGFPGERVILDVSRGLRGFDTVGNIHNWTIANIECAGSGWSVSSNAGKCIGASRMGSRNNFRVVGMYAHDLGQNGTGAFGEFSSTRGLYILGNYTNRTGTPSKKTHVIYHGGRGINENVNIEFNHIRNHIGRRGIQIYGHKPDENMTNLRIRYNNIENNLGSDGILLSFSDSDSTVPHSDPARNWIHDALILGNTVYSGSGPGITVKAAIADVVIKDNVIYDNRWSIYIDFVKTAIITDNCLDKAPMLKQSTGIKIYNNSTNYPHCLKTD